MSNQQGVEEITACVETGKRPHLDGPYIVQVGDFELNFRKVRIEDPVPTGRQILNAAGMRPIEEHLVFQVLRDWELKELRLDETTDLRTARVERFLVFKSAESFRLELDGRVLEWGAPVITGRVLKRLADVDPKTYCVWLEVRGKEDRPIDDDESIQLDKKGLERFFTGIAQATEGATDTRLLPSKDRRYLNDRGIAYREVTDGRNSGVVIRDFSLPEKKFQVMAADVLILLPSGYPDIPPDMFYVKPWLSLVPENRYPTAADQPLQFDGERWQRWSRHNQTWRQGIDGLRTVIKRVETAIAEAV